LRRCAWLLNGIALILRRGYHRRSSALIRGRTRSPAFPVEHQISDQIPLHRTAIVWRPSASGMITGLEAACISPYHNMRISAIISGIGSSKLLAQKLLDLADVLDAPY